MWKLIKQVGASRFMLLWIAIYIAIIINLIVAMATLDEYTYVYLDKCERIAEQSVMFGEHRPYFLTYEDCNEPPRRLKIENYIFVER